MTGIASTARVVIVGGGVVGVSALYHLAKRGWGAESLLMERRELTGGSTWHAAGLLPLFNVSYAVGQLHQYSVELYKTLEAETGQDVSFRNTGNLRLATNKERMDEYHWYRSTAETIGVESRMLSVAEIKDLWPLIKTDGLVGALFHPDDGHIAPVDLTMALAKGARDGGGSIHQHRLVTGIERDRNEWIVSWEHCKTPEEKGQIRCEHVITASGNYALETARKVGLQIPAIPVEHQYIVTDVDPKLQAYRATGATELPVLREPDSSWYLREERGGWILGPYEYKGAPACFVDGVPDSFERDLFPGDLDRLMPHVEACMHRVPSFADAGIKDIVNGPISYAPDGNPMVGPAFGLPNYWISEAHSFGVTAAGGAGWQLANWIIDGEPSVDMLDVDPRRFGVTAKHFARIKNEEAYAHIFVNHFPMEERPAGRNAKTVPCHDRLDRAGAVWGTRLGWERPNWFATQREARRDHYSYRRSNWFAAVGREAALMRTGVGLMELSSFAKYEVEGPGARAFLDRLVANALPNKVGSIRLCHALNPSGSVRSEYTITKLTDGYLGERFYLVGPGAARGMDVHHLSLALPRDGSVQFRDVTSQYGVFVLAGPEARKVLEQVADADVGNTAFPWLTMQDIPLGFADSVRALRVNFVGSLGWELHHPIEYQTHLFDTLLAAGKGYDLGLVGMRALDALRLEKSYRLWGSDLNSENSLLEAGLVRFLSKRKGAFVGKEALEAQRTAGVPRCYCTLEVDIDPDDPADAFGNEPIIVDGEVIGRGTAGGYGHHIKKSLLSGYVQTDWAKEGLDCQVRVLNSLRPARIIAESPYDPDNQALRS